VDARLKGRSKLIPILEATSRTVRGDVHNLSQTPVFDSPAIDGYAVASACMLGALVEKPLALRMDGIIVADNGCGWRFRDETDLIAYGCFTDVVKGGMKFCKDEGQAASDSTSYDGDIALSKKDVAPCVEIMTGARFPQTFVDGGKERMFDDLRKTRRRYSIAVYLSRGELGSFRSRSQCFQTLIDDAPGGNSQRTILWYRNDIPCNRSMPRPLESLGISEIAVSRIVTLSTGEELGSLSAVTKEHLVKGAKGPFPGNGPPKPWS